MVIQTKYFGEIEIEQDKIIAFPEGILGLESYKEYALLEMPENPKFQFMQSIDEIEISFLLVNPWDFFKEYDTDISDEELAVIHVNNIEQIAVFNIITINEDISKSTVNLLAPLIINADTKEGAQVVLKEDKYATKEALFPHKEGEASC